jgi:ABC-2 type transport system permease protein
MKAYRAILGGINKQFYRDRMALFWTFAFPLFFVFIFGFVLGGGEEEVELALGVVAPAGDPLAAGLVQGMRESGVFRVYEGEREAELAALRAGDRDGVLILPPGLAASLFQGEAVEVELFYDAAQGTTSQILLSVVREFLVEAERRARGGSQLLVLSPQPLQARKFRPIDYMLPGILGMSLMQLGLFSVAAVVLQMRERKILRRFWAAPMPRGTFIAAQVTHRVGIALLQAGIIAAVGVLVFGVPFLGQPALMAGVVLLGALTFVSFGYMVASLAPSAEAGTALVQMVNFPMMFLSGVFWPVDWMPGVLRPVVYALPLTYLGDALRQTMVGATPLVPLWVDLAVLGGWLVVTAALSVRFFRWE